jgi:hypothetical protein
LQGTGGHVARELLRDRKCQINRFRVEPVGSWRLGIRVHALQASAAQAALASRDTSVETLCAELGVSKPTIYRNVRPNGELTEQEKGC